MSSNHMNNLTTLIKRLEAATSRLEDIASSSFDAASVASGSVTEPIVIPSQSINTNHLTVPGVAPQIPALPFSSPPESVPRSVEAFDELIENIIKPFMAKSQTIGGLVEQQASSLLKAFEAERTIILVSTKAKQPATPEAFGEIAKGLTGFMSEVDSIKVANRGSPLYSHLTTVADSIAVLAWIQLPSAPAQYISEMLGSAEYWGNRILKEHKDKDQSHVEWVQSYYGIFKAMSLYVKDHYKMGLAWNNSGVDAKTALQQISSGSSGAGGPPPPPPPGPPPPPMKFDAPAPASSAAAPGDMNAVFSELSKGEGVTAGLRKVSPSQQTHKNPALRATSTVPAISSNAPSLSPSNSTTRAKSPLPSRKPESLRTKKLPKKELDGNQYIIENFDNPGEVVTIDATLKHSIIISRCVNTTIRVNGKANAITINTSSGVSLVVDSLVSSVDVIKSPKFEMQILGVVPTVLMDQVDTATIYLSQESLATEFLTSKCSAVNINVPSVKEDGDYSECAVPEQIRTTIRGGRAISEIVEHAG